jgi:N6-L-threonylcarbamoyladenine synthase
MAQDPSNSLLISYAHHSSYPIRHTLCPIHPTAYAILFIMRILGIESSCDETGAAIVEDGRHLISSVVISSLDLHAQFGGVVPEIAARSHIEGIIPLINEALTASLGNRDWEMGNGITNAGTPLPITQPPTPISWNEIDGIAVTYGAGLSGSLLIGVLTARTLAIAKNLPLYGVNHVEAHVYSNFLIEPAPEFPVLSLIVSGGHTQLVLFKDHFDYQILGQTYDDALGEAFDKVAKIIGLPYPGGVSVEKAALLGDPNKYPLPKSKIEGKYNFSFSGLKTAVLRLTQQIVGGDFRTPSIELPALLTEEQRNDIAASFQRVAIETVVEKTALAYQEFKPKSVVIAGGVAASSALREVLASNIDIAVNYAPRNLCTDNGAMVAALGCFKAMRGQPASDPYLLGIEPNLKM